jgi:hypothetical protein
MVTPWRFNMRNQERRVDRGLVGDFNSGLRGALVYLEQVHGQDEPFWTAVAHYTAGLVEMTVGANDEALAA